MARVIMPLLISATSAAYPVIMYAKSPALRKLDPQKTQKARLSEPFVGR